MAFKVSNETKVGALAAIAITLLVLGYNYLSGRDTLFSTGKTYYAYFEDLNGLGKSNPIMYKGYRIGQVADIEFNADEGSFKVELDIQKEVRINNGSVASIADADLFGTKAIIMKVEKGAAELEDGATIKGSSEASMLESLGTTLGPITNRIDSLVATLNATLTGDAMVGTLNNLEATSKNLISLTAKMDKVVENNQAKLNEIFGNVASISKNLANNNVVINSVLRNADSVMNNAAQLELKQTVANANKALAGFNTTLSKINDGNGTLSLLLKDPKMYNNIEKVTKDLDALIVDINRYPKRYFSLGNGKKADKERDKDLQSGEYKP